MKKTYRGSCHCGTVRYEADIDLSAGTSKCNCSICGKGRFWKAIVPRSALRFTAGEDQLTKYTFHRNAIEHFFCPKCGMKPFGRGEIPGFGPFTAVNLATLDDATPEELAAAPVKFQDGIHDRWDVGPSGETRHL